MKLKLSKQFPPTWLKIERRLADHEQAALNMLSNSNAAINLVEAILLLEDVEVMLAIAVDGRNRLRQVVEVARGGIHGCAVTTRDVLRPVLIAGGSSFILAHNHPSGDPTPSGEDVEMTRAVYNASRIVGCHLLDHVIIGGPGRAASMLSLGLIPSFEE